MQTLSSDLDLRPPAQLFVRYINGQIADASWMHVMNAFDADDVTPQERQALASFFRDALVDLGAEAVEVPRQEEVPTLLAELR